MPALLSDTTITGYACVITRYKDYSVTECDDCIVTRFTRASNKRLNLQLTAISKALL